MPPTRRRVLAIGIDAAEPTLVRRLIREGTLPHLRALLEQAAWGRVVSPVEIDDGTVWPTFTTGQSPLTHGVHSPWSWDPERMAVSRVSVEHLTPFWKAAALEGYAVGVLDVPYAPPVGLREGFEVLEWGVHDPILWRTIVCPPGLRGLVSDCGGAHPFARPSMGTWWSAADDAGLAEFIAAALAGVRQRGALAARMIDAVDLDLALVVFSEVHRASHLLWHTVDPAGTGREDRPAGSDAVRRGLVEIFREVDRQIGRLLDRLGSEATVLVFSLHGMQASRGVVTILGPLLRAWGLACPGDWWDASWRERAGRALAAAKRRAPSRLKRIYHRRAPPATVGRLAEPPGGRPGYDWSRTVAFPLPAYQNSLIRLNLAGREARGIVPLARYEATCLELERMLHGLVTEAGTPAVRRVVRPGHGGAAPPERLPDLVVHWEPAATGPPMRLKSPPVSADPSASNMTGRHTSEGFFLLRGRADEGPTSGDAVAARDLHRVILGALRPG